MFPECSLNPMLEILTKAAGHQPKVTMFLNVPWMFPECSLNVRALSVP
jgi:hypothetical protein